MKYLRQPLFLVSWLVLLANITIAADVDSDRVASLNAQISENFASKNWDAVDQGYQELYETYMGSYELSDSAVLPVLRTLGKWKITASRNNLLSKDRSEVANGARDFYASILQEMETKYGNTSFRLIEHLYGQIMAEYQVLQMLITKPVGSFNVGVDDTIRREECRIVLGHERCQMVELPDENYFKAQRDEKAGAIERHSELIEVLLTRVVELGELNQSVSEIEKAEALVHMGDFYLYSEAASAASESYKRAYELLTASPDNADALDILFGQPTRAPALSLSFPGIRSSPSRDNITLAFDIADDGTTANVDVISERDSKNKSFRENAINVVSNSMFRPQLSGGEVLESKRVEMKL